MRAEYFILFGFIVVVVLGVLAQIGDRLSTAFDSVCSGGGIEAMQRRQSEQTDPPPAPPAQPLTPVRSQQQSTTGEVANGGVGPDVDTHEGH